MISTFIKVWLRYILREKWTVNCESELIITPVHAHLPHCASLLGGAIKCMDKRHNSRESVHPPIKSKEHMVRMKSFGDATLYCDIEKYDCQWCHCDYLKHVLTCRFLSWSEKSFMTTAAHTHQFTFCSTSSSVTFSPVFSNAKDFESRSAISTIQWSYVRWDECEYATVQSHPQWRTRSLW
jgi:hypothetical protein